MKLTVNGQELQINAPLSVRELLDQMGYQNRFVAVAINHDCIPRSRFEEAMVKADDRIEILAPMAGG